MYEFVSSSVSLYMYLILMCLSWEKIIEICIEAKTKQMPAARIPRRQPAKTNLYAKDGAVARTDCPLSVVFVAAAVVIIVAGLRCQNA